MKTFMVLFLIIASLPSEAQRVKENLRQRTTISDPNLVGLNEDGVRVVEKKEVKKAGTEVKSKK